MVFVLKGIVTFIVIACLMRIIIIIMCILYFIEGKQAILSGTASRAYKALNQEDKDELVESTAMDYECDDQLMSTKDIKRKAAKIFKKVSNLVRLWLELRYTCV